MLARVFSLSMQLNILPLRLLQMNQEMMFNSRWDAFNYFIHCHNYNCHVFFHKQANR